MRKKLLLLLAMLAMVTVALVVSDYDEGRVERYHQHLEATPAAPCETDAGELCTALPLVVIDAGGQEIPGMNRDGSTVTVRLKVVDEDGVMHHPSDPPTLSSEALLRYRGNSSLFFDKKPYRVKLVDEDGAPHRAEMLGMPAEDEWILNGPFLDKTLIRNYLCMNISAEVMGDAPEVRFCEVVLDGNYQGVYVMMESVSRSSVGIEKSVDGRAETNYLVRLDRGGLPGTNLNDFNRYTIKTEAVMNVVYPTLKNITPEQFDYIERDLSQFQKALYSLDYDDPVLGYDHYIDVGSFVDYMIINEFFQNYDAGSYSTYFHKEVGGKLTAGPVWDFNNAMDNYMEIDWDSTDFLFQKKPLYNMLLRDQRFTEKVIRRYRELRKTVLSDEYLQAYVDETAAYLGGAVDRNFSVWGYSFLPENGLLEPKERNLSSYEEALGQLKTFIHDRGEWLDTNIELLRQFSHESKTKQFQH